MRGRETGIIREVGVDLVGNVGRDASVFGLGIGYLRDRETTGEVCEKRNQKSLGKCKQLGRHGNPQNNPQGISVLLVGADVVFVST